MRNPAAVRIALTVLLAAMTVITVIAPAAPGARAESPDRFAAKKACRYRVPLTSGLLWSETRPLAALGKLVLRVDGRPRSVSARGLDVEALSKEWTACDCWRTLDTDRHVGKALPRLVVPGSGPLAAQPGARLTFIYLYGAG